MKVNYNQFLAVVYGDVFDWPLKLTEARAWQIKDKRFGTKDRKLEERDGCVFLPGRGNLVKQRLVKEKISARKKMIAEVVTSLLAKISTVEAIFLTGSVAVGSAKKTGDIDLMIITRPNALWLTRAVVVVLLKMLRSYGNGTDRICPNIFLDTDHLEIKEKNLYTAHEILQANCLFDRGEIERKWLLKNRWTKKYLPNVYKFKFENSKLIENCSPRTKSRGKFQISNYLWIPIELITFTMQYFYMKSRMTNERVGWGYAFFHPDKLGPKIEDKFRQRLVKYSVE